MELYDKVKNRLAEVNSVKTANHCYYKLDNHRWSVDKVKPETVQDTIEDYVLVRKLCEIPHKFNMVGSVLVVTKLDLTKMLKAE